MQQLDNKISINQILNELIRIKGISITELARKIDVPQPTLQRIISGKHINPHKKTLNAISNFFDITVEQLCGLENIPILKLTSNAKIKKIPLLGIETNQIPEMIIIDQEIGDDAFAIKMSDSSMEPLIYKGSILIVNPNKQPKYKSLIVVKLNNHEAMLVRQLLNDGDTQYIRPLCQDLNKISMIKLTCKDIILGVIVEIRHYFDE